MPVPDNACSRANPNYRRYLPTGRPYAVSPKPTSRAAPPLAVDHRAQPLNTPKAAHEPNAPSATHRITQKTPSDHRSLPAPPTRPPPPPPLSHFPALTGRPNDPPLRSPPPAVPCPDTPPQPAPLAFLNVATAPAPHPSTNHMRTQDGRNTSQNPALTQSTQNSQR
ncbi:hypothetical protein WJX73_004997 [Symbiochloris irregularis]|uniref:Uncharacterized protein n=1 Tax=Symbiochloris irregularis TaxID=706552 RepID=A0AAW1NP23_9CHLO